VLLIGSLRRRLKSNETLPKEPLFIYAALKIWSPVSPLKIAGIGFTEISQAIGKCQ
jgi:hypothetical protein